jgi:hypothetical protein
MAIVGAAAGIRADESSVDVREAAAAAGVDPQLLQGAINSVGTDPYTYLRSTGELPPLPQSIGSIWQRLAQCESSGNWASRSNPIYRGGLQFDAATWSRYGGLAFAPRADLATPAQQIQVAQRTLAAQGPAAWPVCSRVVGLR